MSPRIRRLRRALKDRGFDAMLVSSLPNIRYLSGFTGTHALCVVTAAEKFFLTDSRYAAQSQEETPGWRRAIAARDLFEEAAALGTLRRCRRVAFEAEDVTVASYRRLRGAVPRGIRLAAATGLVEGLALRKDAEELAALRRAAAVTDCAFEKVLAVIRPGVREREVAAEISYVQRACGGEGDAFEPIVASGPRSALPHARASARKIRKGEPIVLDFGTVIRGYASDLTRTVFVGRPSARMREVYAVVRDAQECAIAVARGGMMACDLDRVARSIIATAGFGTCFPHSLGHGLGLHVHEPPRVSALSRERLAPGSVITIEPGIYLEGIGGVRIEDDVVLHASGCTKLTHASKELFIL